jgi:hypothetical protein
MFGFHVTSLVHNAALTEHHAMKVYVGSGGKTKVYPKVSGLAAWSENCKWYSSLPLGAVVSPFYESV